MLTTTLLLSAALIAPNGALIQNESTCYTTSVQKADKLEVLGITWQSIQRAKLGERDVIKVVIHQSMANGKFDMLDSFVLDAKDLQAIEFNNERHGKRHVQLTYSEGRVRGTRLKPDGSSEMIDVVTGTPIWDGNLYGVVFAALPLTHDAQFRLPTYQYDRGLGEFKLKVITQEAGVWELEVENDDKLKPRYQIGQTPRRELGYKAGPYVNALGGDCTALEQKAATRNK
jgi:hypothetical protein